MRRTPVKNGMERGAAITTRARVGATMGLLVAAACAPPPAQDGGDVEETESPVINGTVVSSANAPANPGTVAVYHGFVRPCSGTLIRRQWVLTARHCLTSDASVFGPLVSLSTVKVVRATSPGLTPPAGASSAVAFLPHDAVDIALVKISPEIASPVGLSDATMSSLTGLTLRSMGFGRSVDGGDPNMENGTSGAGTLRMADLLVTGVSTGSGGQITLNANSINQILWHGDSGGPSYKMSDILGRSLPGVAGVHNTSNGVSQSFDADVDTNRKWIKEQMFTPGAFLGAPASGIALTGGAGWSTIPTLWVDIDSADQGGPFFFETNQNVPNFPTWAQTAGTKAVSGDFNGDRRADIALMGGAGWSTVPVAFNTGGGNFSVTNLNNATIANLTVQSDARVTSGDINGDGKTDVVAMRGSSSQVTVATSNGDGTFGILQTTLNGNFLNVSAANARLLSGDFDGDGRDDVMVLGNSPTTVPIAFSNGSGAYFSTNSSSTLATWAQASGAKAVVGDFNADGRDDVALTGGSGWTDIRVAFSAGNGTFTTGQFPVPNFPAWSRTSGVRMVSGDYDGDGFDDIALIGGTGWGTVPIAFAHPGFFFETNNGTVVSSWVQSAGPVKVVSGH